MKTVLFVTSFLTGYFTTLGLLATGISRLAAFIAGQIIVQGFNYSAYKCYSEA